MLLLEKGLEGQEQQCRDLLVGCLWMWTGLVRAEQGCVLNRCLASIHPQQAPLCYASKRAGKDRRSPIGDPSVVTQRLTFCLPFLTLSLISIRMQLTLCQRQGMGLYQV